MKRPNWLKLSPPLVFGLVAVGVLGSLGWVVVYLPQLQTAPLSQKIKDYETLPKPDPKELATLEKGRIDSENAIRTGFIQGIGGTVLLIGLYFTYRNLKVAEDKQVIERFSKAVNMLSSSSMHTRLGGIYALERIARDSDDYYWQVMEVLTAFVREESPWPPKTEKTEPEGTTAEAKGVDQIEAPQPVAERSAAVEASQSAALQSKLSDREQRLKELRERLEKLPPLRTDIQAVMTVIVRRKHSYGEGENQQLDLRQTDLRQLQAHGANLTGAKLKGARLEDADLSKVDLREADLRDAHLEQAYLGDAHLEQANLKNAHLENVILCSADLWEAYLWGAHLEDAYLGKAHLEQARLSGVDLSQVFDLTQAQLDSALTDQNTKLPNYLLAAQPQTQAPIAPPSTATPEPNSEPQPPAT